MAQSTYANSLEARGFQVLRPLSGANHSAAAAGIYEVCDLNHPGAETYAAKVISLAGLDAKGKASAHQEVSLLKGLAAHPNLIAYRESFLEDEAEILFIVMSLAEDGDLRNVVTRMQVRKRLIPEPISLYWLRQTLAGLAHLHSQGVVHRDLKSSNIFLSGSQRCLRIGDFGISRVLESTALASSCVGTPAYMSPELIRNERYDYHVDMWALGCICFELTTLTLPFTANSLLEFVYAVTETEPEWARWTGSQELLSVCDRLLRKNAAERPTSFDLIEEAMFSEAQEPAVEAWAQVAPDASSPQKRRSGASQNGRSLSLLTTLDEGALSQSESGKGATGGSGASSNGWLLTPRMPFENSSLEANSSLRTLSPSRGHNGSSQGSLPARAEDFFNQLQAMRMERKTFTRDEFHELLTSHRELLFAEREGNVQAANYVYAQQGLQVHQEVPEEVV